MSKHPVVARRPRPLRERAGGALAEPPAGAVEPVGEAPSAFVSFTFSSTELWSAGGRTHVRSRTTQLSDGRLRTESFEGELPGGAFEQAARHVSGQFAQALTAQLALLWQPLAWLLPRRDDRR